MTFDGAASDLAAAMRQRMVNQGVWRPVASDIPGVVRSFVGMQAQEFRYALWAIAQRMSRPGGSAEMLQAFDEGVLLRTHVLRPTWHFALPDDIRWMLRLTAPKLRRLMAYYSRQHGLDEAELARSRAVLAGAVAGGQHHTRRELADHLEAAGVQTAGMRLGFLLTHAEYDEVLISGAISGKQQTYASFDERVPAGPDYSEDEALAELARRFVTSRAPVTAKDLAGWASLTLAQARRGLAAIESECEIRELDGMTMWWGPGSPPSAVDQDRPGPIVDLVQGYDELVMSYFESRRLLAPKGVLPVADYASHLHAVLLDGFLVGHWRHQRGRDGAAVDVQLRRPLVTDELIAVRDAVDRYGAYLGVPTTLTEPVLL
jgi:hypothetical protein